MRRGYRVLWSDVAENDLRGIINYIAGNNPATARQILEKIKTKTDTLFVFPEKGRVVPELLEQGIAQYHELVVSPWRIIYKIGEHEIFVLSVLDSRRNIEDILLRRLIGH